MSKTTRISIFTILLIATMLLAILVPCSLTARAEEEMPTLLFANGEQNIAPESESKDPISGILTYTFCYEPDMVLRIKGTLSGDTVRVEGGQSVITAAGENYQMMITVNGTPYTCRVIVKKKSVAISWKVDSLTSEYSVLPSPQVETGGIPCAVEIRTKGGQELTSTMAIGTHEITAKVKDTETNYTSDLLEGVLTVVPYSQPIILNATPSTVTLLGDGTLDLASLFGVDAHMHDIQTYYSIVNGSLGELLPQSRLTKAGDMYITFAYKGDASCFEHPQTTAQHLVVQKASTSLSVPDSVIEIPYSSASTMDWAYLLSVLQSKRGTAFRLQSGEYILSTQEISYSINEIPITWEMDKAYTVQLTFAETPAYLPTTAEIQFAIVPFDISPYIDASAVGNATLPYSGEPHQAEYQITFGEYTAWANANAYTPTVSYEKDEGGVWTTSSSAIEPGVYRMVVRVDTPYYQGEKTSYPFEIIRKPLAAITVNPNTAVYGDYTPPVLSISGVVGAWVYTYRAQGTTEWRDSPDAVGIFDMRITLTADPHYQYDATVADAVTITARPLVAYVADFTIRYGDEFHPQLQLADAQTALDASKNIFLEGVLEAEVSAVLRSFAFVLDAPKELGVNSSGYAVAISLDNANYALTVGRQPVVKVIPRPINIKVDSLDVFEQSPINATIKLADRMAYSDDEAVLLGCYTLYYMAIGEAPTTEVPAMVGKYTMRPTLQPVLSSAQSAMLAKYEPIVTDGVLNIKRLSLPTTHEHMLVEGRFKDGQTLQVVNGDIAQYTTMLGSAIPRGYKIAQVYEVKETISAEGGSVTVRLYCPQTNMRLLVQGNAGWEDTAYTREGDYIVYKKKTLSTAYVLCAKNEINWPLYGGIGGGVVAFILIIVFAVVGSKNAKYRKLKKAQSAKVSAPTGSYVSEDDEFDQLLEEFDESTIQREMTPAERIALREKEEKYNQYRLRLQRMRGAGDKAVQDQLGSLSIGAQNDDEIIERMIRADEERALALEQELQEEIQEEERAKDTAVIVGKHDEDIEQRSFAPTMPTADDDDVDF